MVDANLHPQTVDVIKSRAENIGVEIVEIPLATKQGVEELSRIADKVCGALVQYPDTNGEITDFTEIGNILHSNKALFAMATDLLALTVLKPPSEFGADIALGTSQRFGVPFGYGGPHAAFFATSSKYARKIPGRIVGVSKDRLGNPALRLALQTREQHIKREKPLQIFVLPKPYWPIFLPIMLFIMVLRIEKHCQQSLWFHNIIS